MNNIQTVIFDFDGVLFDSASLKDEVFLELFKEHREHLPAFTNYLKDNGGLTRQKKINYFCSKFLNKNLSKQEESLLIKKFKKICWPKLLKAKPIDGAYQFLNTLFNRIPLFIVSGAPHDELEILLKNHNLNKFFNQYYGSLAKKPELISQVIKENNFTPKKSIYIGDALSDKQAAKKCKINFIYFSKSNDLKCKYFAPDFPHLYKLINNFEYENISHL